MKGTLIRVRNGYKPNDLYSCSQDSYCEMVNGKEHAWREQALKG